MTCRIFSTEPPLAQPSLVHEVGEIGEEEEETFVSKVKKTVYKIMEPLEYHWHKLGLQLWDEESEYGGSHVVGGAMVGDCVEDEWFVTWVLAEATKILPIIVQVSDGDGEFLLIEAATGLPDCLSPENGSNRAWILRGDLHVLVPGDNTGCITWQQGLRAMRDGQVAPIPGSSQIAFQERIRLYPGKILREMKHKVRAILPVRAAATLLSSTQLLSSSIHAYCEEAEEPRWGRARQFGTFGFGLGHGSGRKEWELKDGDCFGLVEIRLSIPRHLYAMLISQPGQLWEGKLIESWHKGRCGGCDLKGDEELHWNLKSTRIGARLSLGLELACAAAKEFGEYSGAALGRALEKREYCSNKRAIAIGCMLATSIAQEFQCGVLEATKPSISCLFRTDFPPIELKDEDEGWLVVDPKQLEADLIRQHGVERSADSSSSREEDAALCGGGGSQEEEEKGWEHLHHISEAFNSFVGDMKSGLEGAEVPRYNVEEGDGQVSFDAERFMSILAGDDDTSVENCGDCGEFGWADDDGFMAEIEASCARMGAATNEEDGEEDAQESEAAEDPACFEFTDGDKVFMEQCVAAMREELDEHEVIGSECRLRKEASSQLSHTKSVGPLKVGSGDGESDPEDEAHLNIDAAQELDIDLNLVKNLVDSFASQKGASGPASNLLREMGIGVPTYIDSGRGQRT